MGAASSTAGGSAVNLTVQTVFTPPASCAGRPVTQMSISGSDYWRNAIQPVATMTMSSCYPEQFWSSAAATTSLGPFAQLICPKSWEQYNINATYIVCCPEGFGLWAPQRKTNTDRPASRALCTSSIWPGLLFDVKTYNASGFNGSYGTTAGSNGILVLATPFDGIVASTTLTGSALSTSISASAQAASATAMSTTATSSAAKSGAASSSSSNNSGSTASTTSFIPVSTLA